MSALTGCLQLRSFTVDRDNKGPCFIKGGGRGAISIILLKPVTGKVTVVGGGDQENVQKESISEV